MNALTQYYVHQAGGGGRGVDIGPIYSLPPFHQRGQGIGDIFCSFLRIITPWVFSGIKSAGKGAAKALGREALRKGSRILTDIADNPQTGYRDIISKHVLDTFKNLSARMMGKWRRKRKRRSTVRGRPSSKRPKRSALRKSGRSLDAKRPHLEKALF
jgi:hypothetical protein